MATPNLNRKLILLAAVMLLLSAGVAAKAFKVPFTGLAAFNPGNNAGIKSYFSAAGGTNAGAHNAPSTILLFTQLVDSYYASDVIVMAGKVTQLDALIRGSGSRKLAEIWLSTTSCMVSSCDKESVYTYATSAIEDVAEKELAETGDAKYELIIAALEADRLWGTKDLVGFSNQLTKANDIVVAISDADVSESWGAYVSCGGKCPERMQLKFDFIKAIASLADAQ